MLAARQSYHVMSEMVAGSSNSDAVCQHQTLGASTRALIKRLSIRPLNPEQRRAVQVCAGNSSSTPPAGLKRRKNKSDTISMLREALDVGRRSEIDSAYQEGSVYLQSLGIESKGEIARILDIAMNPNSLFFTLRDKKRAINIHARQLSVKDDMKPVVEALQKHGLSDKDIARIITDHPPVLCYNAEERIYPFFEFLKSVGIPPEKIAKRPTLIGLEVNKGLRRIVDYLQEVEGKSMDEVAELLETI